MRDELDRAFSGIAETRQVGLRRTAAGLCGSWTGADDLVQTTLVKLYRAWPLRSEESVDAWLRRALVRAHIDQTRRSWWRLEHLTGDLPERAAPAAAPAIDAELVRHLQRLPARQRACLVLRFLDDCSVEEAAAALGCAPGTVKSQTARGLEAIRALMGVRLTPRKEHCDD